MPLRSTSLRGRSLVPRFVGPPRASVRLVPRQLQNRDTRVVVRAAAAPWAAYLLTSNRPGLGRRASTLSSGSGSATLRPQ